MTQVRFGANYTPSGDWFYSWYNPNWERIARDFDAIAALGLDHVRLLPLWEVMQPNASLIRADAVNDVRHMAQLAAAAGLDSSVDVLQGHLSSFDFLPNWAVTWHKANMFTDPATVHAQQRLVSALSGALADIPSFLGLNLGNELNQFASTVHPDPMVTNENQVDGWLEELLNAPGKPAGTFRLHSEYDAVWFQEGHPFMPRHVARAGDLSTVHSWIFNGTAGTYGAASQESYNLATYLVELARAFATDPSRSIWLQEVGAPIPPLTHTEAPKFCEETVERVVDTERLWGITWWCSHDVPLNLAGFPPLEHSLGLFDEDGKVKPLGRAFAAAAAAYRDRPVPPVRTVAVEVPVDAADNPLLRPEMGPGGGIFETWMRLAAEGQRPTLVTSSAAARPSELQSRGVKTVVAAKPTGRGTYSSVSDDEIFEV